VHYRLALEVHERHGKGNHPCTAHLPEYVRCNVHRRSRELRQHQTTTEGGLAGIVSNGYIMVDGIQRIYYGMVDGSQVHNMTAVSQSKPRSVWI
jgi:hypothetical protein